MFTSNRADMTRDLANRSSCVRLLKQPDGHDFPRYSEGDVLAHVRANQPRYLGAVFAVIRAWHTAGKPRTNETRHDFKAWVQILDWIVQELLHSNPIMDGHRETQKRMTNPALNWIRDVALAVVRCGRSGEWMIAHELMEVVHADGTVEVPSLSDGDSFDDDDVSKKVLQQVGKKMKRCFADADSVTIDRVIVNREQYFDGHGQRYRYQVVEAAELEAKLPIFPPDQNDDSVRNDADDQVQIDGSPDGSPDAPLIDPLMNSRHSLDSPNTSIPLIENSHSLSHRGSIGNHQRIRGNQGASGECQHEFTNGEPDPTLEGYTKYTCVHCGKFGRYESPRKEPVAA
jgi:hypothetical protein